ncbi:MAG: HEAT repeat domain-containing protein [Cyanobacteria bacterium MAG IRC3_bin_20]|nr:HEAT repeat domain-containing protein [Cyanobacteria bacterium MAG IRC3_bin_20]
MSGQKITITRACDGHRHTQTVPPEMKIVVDRGDQVALNQIIALRVRPEADDDLRYSQELTDCQLLQLLSFRERTQRFTVVKLARLQLRRSDSLTNTIVSLERDQEEDVYIRLEAAAYLVAICHMRAQDLFMPYLKHCDEQIQLEAVISLREAGTQECVRILSTILNDAERPYFARSAAAWSLSRINDSQSCQCLVQAFGDINPKLREEALEGIVSLHSDAVPSLLSGLQAADPAIAAGCAEALRQHGALPADAIDALTGQLAGDTSSKWAVWLAGHLPREWLAGVVTDLQEMGSELHYAITVLWSFAESWIARHWELHPSANFPHIGHAQ